VWYLLEKRKSTGKWTHAVHTHVVQGSTVEMRKLSIKKVEAMQLGNGRARQNPLSSDIIFFSLSTINPASLIAELK